MQIALTTELAAVNTMLSIIGESPVNALDGSAVDAATAQGILADTSLEVQSRGWFWNTDQCVKLLPTVPDGFLQLPPNTVEVRNAQTTLRLTQRGTRLYDAGNQTFAFTQPVVADLVTVLDFETLPQPARNYIVVRAGRIFQDRQVGSKELSGFNEKDEMRALVTLQNAEAEASGASMGSSLGGILDRRFGTLC